MQTAGDPLDPETPAVMGCAAGGLLPGRSKNPGTRDITTQQLGLDFTLSLNCRPARPVPTRHPSVPKSGSDLMRSQILMAAELKSVECLRFAVRKFADHPHARYST